jgi:hypothetical protein
MTIFQLYLLFVAGILLSILLPVAKKWVKAAQDPGAEHGIGEVLKIIKPYALAGIGSAVIGFALLLLFYQTSTEPEKTTWFNAMLYGYAWDSTLQKLTT